PSFFEITVAMAFAYFALQNVDVAVIEVGLGGRLDSTNIIMPEVSVITNIGWDHMNMLGETLPEIAREKGGIIKPGIPVVIGEVLEETKPVFEQLAEQNHAPLFYAEAAFEAEAPQWKEGHLYVEVMQKNGLKKDLYELDLPGIYQKKNLCTVLATIEVLRNRSFEISDRELAQGLQNTQLLTGLSGRWELIHRDPMIILEVAHNKNGMEQLLQHLQHISFGKLHLILGMVKDKDLDQVLSLLPANAQYYFTQAQIPRALPAPELQQKAARFSLEGVVCGEVNQALEKALAAADPADLILICGSIFLVAEVRRPA
ncbi:MAG: bifunctional folylpolyglutamate synthase/dihydrofolate synthase, partial [Flavisolibacter sp.]